MVVERGDKVDMSIFFVWKYAEVLGSLVYRSLKQLFTGFPTPPSISLDYIIARANESSTSLKT